MKIRKSPVSFLVVLLVGAVLPSPEKQAIELYGQKSIEAHETQILANLKAIKF